MDPARMFLENLTPSPELENNQGHLLPRGFVPVVAEVSLITDAPVVRDRVSSGHLRHFTPQKNFLPIMLRVRTRNSASTEAWEMD
jgi:hypothetical protein